MNIDSDRIQTDVFIIPLLGRFLVYAPLRRTAFIANATAVNLLARLRQGPVVATDEGESSFLHFCRQIHLTGKDGDSPIGGFEWCNYQPTEATLFLTSRCNLRCIYCYASAGEHPVAEMSLSDATRGIEFVSRNALERGKREFGIGYHGGGEPTTHWEVLTQSFAFAQRIAKENGLDVYGSMATNGVLSKEKREWIVRNFRGVNLSIDGLPAIQDQQRPLLSGQPSSEAVLQTLQSFDAANFQYGIRVTVTAASIDRLPQSIQYLLNHAHPKHIQVEPMYVLGRGREINLEVRSDRFVDAFREARCLAVRAGVDFFFSAARVDVLTNRFCQSCGEGFSLTPNGRVSACYEVPGEDFPFAEQFIIGHYDADQGRYYFEGDKLARLREQTVERIPWCQNCFCKWHCAGDCMYKSLHASADGQFAGDARCEITQALTLEQILEKITASGGTVWAENSRA